MNWNLIVWPALLCILAFYMVNNLRRQSVTGSRASYVTTGWAWLLLWPSYAGVALSYFGAITTQDPISAISVIFLSIHIPTIRRLHLALINSDDDNPWRQLKTKLRAGIKRLAKARMPKISIPSPMPSPSAA